MSNDTTKVVLRRIFDQLDKWRHLPSYKLENRVDAYFGMFMETVIPKHIKVVNGGAEVNVKGVIAEFPLRLGTLYPEGQPRKKGQAEKKPKGKPEDDNQSKKVDFAVFSEKTIYLVDSVLRIQAYCVP